MKSSILLSKVKNNDEKIYKYSSSISHNNNVGEN